MIIICDAPGQTCNRLWSYAASIAECIVKKKRLMIIFYDWTIEDFPNLLHCPWIYFPLWHKWYIERGNGWNNYKGLTWKVCHNKTWDKIFKTLGCKKGWWTRQDNRYLQQTLHELQHIYRPKQEIIDKRYDHYEERRQEAIKQAREIRTKILKEEEEQKDGSNPNRVSKYSTSGFKSTKKEENDQAKESGMIKKELEKLLVA
jgi:hypothetical protein